MIRKCMAAALVLLVTGPAASVLSACGDKFLVPGRGMRLELTPLARRQASVLLYANPATPLPATLARLSIDPTLRKAGYRPTIVETADSFDSAMQQGQWDVVLLDLADGPAIGERAPGEEVTVLAVAQNATGPEFAIAKKRYAAVLKSPTRSQAFVDALDSLVAARREAKAKAEKKGTVK
jgi:hypothetical protein